MPRPQRTTVCGGDLKAGIIPLCPPHRPWISGRPSRRRGRLRAVPTRTRPGADAPRPRASWYSVFRERMRADPDLLAVWLWFYDVHQKSSSPNMSYPTVPAQSFHQDPSTLDAPAGLPGPIETGPAGNLSKDGTRRLRQRLPPKRSPRRNGPAGGCRSGSAPFGDQPEPAGDRNNARMPDLTFTHE